MTPRRMRSTRSRKGSSSSIRKALVLCPLLILALSSGAEGAELSIPALSGAPGEVLEVPLVVDAVDNMAGVKLVMRYDPELLSFKRGTKTRHTESLMHIVNDKTPGRLIIVMAGARGINGKDFSIFNLFFKINDKAKGNHTTAIEITQVEMMSDKLQPVPCKVRSEPLVVRTPD